MMETLKALVTSVISSNSNINILVFSRFIYLVIRFKLSVVQYINWNALPGQAVLTCNKCDKVYTFNFSVNIHIRNTHLEIMMMMMMMMILKLETFSLNGRLKVKKFNFKSSLTKFRNSTLQIFDCLCFISIKQRWHVLPSINHLADKEPLVWPLEGGWTCGPGIQWQPSPWV